MSSLPKTELIYLFLYMIFNPFQKNILTNNVHNREQHCISNFLFVLLIFFENIEFWLLIYIIIYFLLTNSFAWI